MELRDGISIFMAGLALGLIGAHHLNRHEVKQSYERGILDALWEVQRLAMVEHLTRSLAATGNKTTGSADSDGKSV